MKLHHQLARRLHLVPVEFVVFVFLFWLAQLCAWIFMMTFVQFFDPKLGNNVLYVTQISHWALVLSCGVAAIATWGVIQSKHNSRKLEQHREQDMAVLQKRIEQLASLEPGPSADALAEQIRESLR